MSEGPEVDLRIFDVTAGGWALDTRRRIITPYNAQLWTFRGRHDPSIPWPEMLKGIDVQEETYMDAVQECFPPGVGCEAHVDLHIVHNSNFVGPAGAVAWGRYNNLVSATPRQICAIGKGMIRHRLEVEKWVAPTMISLVTPEVRTISKLRHMEIPPRDFVLDLQVTLGKARCSAKLPAPERLGHRSQFYAFTFDVSPE